MWALVFLAIIVSFSTLSAHTLRLSSIESVPALLDTARVDSIVVLEFTASQRLDRAHRAIQFVWDFRATQGAAFDTSSIGAYQRLLAAPRDSSARIKNFTYQLKDQLQVSLFHPREFHPLFLKPPAQIIQWSTKLDSAGTYVIVRETVGDVDVRIPLKIPWDEYIRLSLADAQRRSFADRAHQYALKEGKQDDFGALLGSVTKIEIPVPANPVFSVFGKPSISLNISGDVNIRAAYRSVTQDEATISSLGNTRNEPDFAQVVRLNVDGLIGDKLAIRANWDTQTQFEYENRLSLVYTGYDDEIVKKVEAGNVSLSTPSSFIGNSQALFGIKTTMQFGPLTLTALASQKKGQMQELTVSGGSSETSFDIYPYQYSTNHYFIDVKYSDSARYENFYDTPTHQLLDNNLVISEIEVYKSRYGTTADNGNERKGVAYINLDSLPPSGKYDDKLRDSATVKSGEIEIGNFVRLDPSAYTIEKFTGILTLNNPPQDGEIIAIAYRRNDGNTYGDFAAKADTSKQRVLKLVKPANLIPSYTTAWSLLVKNRYQIGGGRRIKKEKFVLDIYYWDPREQATPVDQLYGQSLLQVFHLDKSNDAGEMKPDNNFDFNSGYTIDQERGELIFPTLMPFKDAIPRWWKENSVKSDKIPDSLTYPEIYDTTMAIASQSVHNRFTVSGKYSSEVNAKYNIGFNVVQNSVQVLLDGVPLQAGTDYSVDYNLGEVVIRRDDALVPGKNLQLNTNQTIFSKWHRRR